MPSLLELHSATPVATPETYSLLVKLNASGVRLRVEDGRIRWRASAAGMTVALIREVKAREAELLAILEELAVVQAEVS